MQKLILIMTCVYIMRGNVSYKIRITIVYTRM